MVKVFYNNGSTYLMWGYDKTIRTDDLSMCEAMVFALELKIDFDWEDVTTDETMECIDELRDRGVMIEKSPTDFSMIMINYTNMLKLGDD